MKPDPIYKQAGNYYGRLWRKLEVKTVKEAREEAAAAAAAKKAKAKRGVR